uniref:uncharacterized protein n=1 Tax=Centroberyx gerrardi TaxID=166262 RepID=UPI003AADEE72
METMVRSALTQVCRLVDEDSAGLRAELSRLLVANAALTEKLNSLQCELTVVRSDGPKLSKSSRTVGVQTTGGSRDRDGHVTGPPTIEGIFGKDWCMDLWNDSIPYSLETVRYSTQSSDKSVVPLSDQIAVTEIKEEDYEEELASTCRQETLNTEEHEECLAQEAEELSIEFSADDSRLSFDQEEEQVLSAGGLGEPSMQLISSNDAEEVYSTHIIPIDEEEEEEEDEDEDEDDDGRIRNSCELCGKTFTNPSALRIHYLVHTGEKPHR